MNDRNKSWTDDQISESVWLIEGGISVVKLKDGRLSIFMRSEIVALTITPEQASRIDGIANPEKRYTGSKECGVVKESNIEKP